METIERDKLIELTKKAISINEQLLCDEKKFLTAISSQQDTISLQEMNESLNNLCGKEHLYLAAAKSLLQMINR